MTTASSAACPGGEPASGSLTKVQTPVDVAHDAEFFIGWVKSYNDRRRFGFVACEETARRFGRDVYLSKVESLAALQSEDTALKEGDHVRFAVVPSSEGFPQAVGVQRLQILHGSVSRFCTASGGVIMSNEASLAGCAEVLVRPGGHLLLHQGDEVTFCLERDLVGSEVPEASLVQLQATTRSPCAMLGCFSIEFPRVSQEANNNQSASGTLAVAATSLVVLDAHAFGNQICLSGLPADLHDVELMAFFGKYGANQATAVHADGRGFASLHFPGTIEVARLLAGGAHAFTDKASTTLVRFGPCRKCTGPTLPAMPAPGLVQGETGNLVVCWSPLSMAVAYRVELRTAGAASHGWSVVDANGNVQPAGATPMLSNQATCLAISGLSVGVSYEARVSYVTSCGCSSEASDPSAPFASGPAPLQPSVGPPSVSQPPTLAMPLQQPSMPCFAKEMPGCVASFPAPNYNPALQFQHGLPPLPIAYPPEVTVCNDSTTSLCIRWQTSCQAASYSVELRESVSGMSDRFFHPAPSEAFCLAELRVGGLVPGRFYTACIRSLSQSGCESAPSGWSSWCALPAQQLYAFQNEIPFHDFSMVAPSAKAPVTLDLPTCVPEEPQTGHLKAEKLLASFQDLGFYGAPAGLMPPEVTGHEMEEVLFLD